MVNKSLDYIKLLIIVFSLMVGYVMVRNITEPLVCVFTTCKAELEQTIKDQKQKIKTLESDLETAKKNHKLELESIKNNKEIVKETQEKSETIDKRKADIGDKVKLAVSQTTPVVKVTRQVTPTKTQEVVLKNNSQVLPDAQVAEIQIDALWEMYCSSDYTNCKG